jgi:hypothetical protein
MKTYAHNQRAKMQLERGSEEEQCYMVAIRLAAYMAKRKHLTEPWGPNGGKQAREAIKP